MAFYDHITRCNTWTPARYRPFLAAGHQVGWVRDDNARALADFPGVMTVTDAAVTLAPALDTPAARTEALRDVVAGLAEKGALDRLRGEDFPVRNAWTAPEVMRLDRAAAPFFGVKAYGVHLNGYVPHGGGGLSLWVGRRAADKPVAPGKLDNIVAGGQPAGLSLHENMLKEAAEEAAMTEALATGAVPCGAITYCLEDATGLKPDTMYVFDLALPEDFVPFNTDGEIAEFMLWPTDKVLHTVRETEDFKFNVNLVILDFAVRHGLLHPDSEPEYDKIIRDLRRPHPGLDDPGAGR